MKRALIIIAIIVLIVAIGSAVFFFLLPQTPGSEGRNSFLDNLPIIGNRMPSSTTQTPSVAPPSGENTVQPPEKRMLSQIIASEVLSPVLSADAKSILFAIRENGHIARVDFEGKNQESVANITVPGLFDASWAPQKTTVAMSYYEDGVAKNFLNSLATGTPSRFLPRSVTSFDWSPDGKSISYLLKRSQDTALTIATAAGQNAQVVYTTPIPDFTIRWVSPKTILLISRPSGLAPSLVIGFNTTSRNSSILLKDIRGVTLLPLPDASGFIFGQSDERGVAQPLNFYHLRDSKITPLGITTFPEKCTFSKDGKTMYCGVPENISAPAPDEWYKGAVSLSDRIVQVDLATNDVTPLANELPHLDVTSPFLTPDSSDLFFKDKNSGTLWRLRLTQE